MGPAYASESAQKSNYFLEHQSNNPFLQQIENEEFFKTSIIFGKPIKDYPLEEILQKDLKKVLVLKKDLTNEKKCCGYHTKFLSITYWHEEYAKDLLKILADILRFKRYNKMVFPLNITVGESLFYEDIYKLTQQELIDIPASLILSTKLWSLHKKLRSYTIRFNDILMNLNIVSGMFGGSFKLLPNPSKSLRLLYISTFLSGLTYTIILSTRMQVFLTYPYTYRIKSLKDLSFYNLRVLIPKNDYLYMMQYYNFSSERMSIIFKVAQNYKEFSQAQSSLNTSYAYPISSSLWFMYNALQTYRNKPIFRLTRMCFPNTSLMTFVLPPDSLFMDSLNRLITRARDMGLLEFWLKTSYIDLVKMKMIYLQKDRIVVKKSVMGNIMVSILEQKK
ncbi:uncharacterized protein LOC119616370 [Lucilia sericata]|uniref:uncharacterized protein LOC119616370 n=1 Tax=Lucilia sericata TaxID=13632 RepID=UPI0018A8412B|nr:uncharacterized protein LOC119616370 [Lucilia sericata]